MNYSNFAAFQGFTIISPERFDQADNVIDFQGIQFSFKLCRFAGVWCQIGGIVTQIPGSRIIRLLLLFKSFKDLPGVG